jgi:hypothetical protein
LFSSTYIFGGYQSVIDSQTGLPYCRNSIRFGLQDLWKKTWPIHQSVLLLSSKGALHACPATVKFVEVGAELLHPRWFS